MRRPIIWTAFLWFELGFYHWASAFGFCDTCIGENECELHFSPSWPHPGL